LADEPRLAAPDHHAPLPSDASANEKSRHVAAMSLSHSISSSFIISS
jgi:hypothetical protein